mmetsp:Transcript_40493/g.61762  ORF Transcript_40493/g.61762 Transcript_40493/m.61762 type:complete len:120 (-) Transcript_40493:126-485(-)
MVTGHPVEQVKGENEKGVAESSRICEVERAGADSCGVRGVSGTWTVMVAVVSVCPDVVSTLIWKVMTASEEESISIYKQGSEVQSADGYDSFPLGEADAISYSVMRVHCGKALAKAGNE